MLGGGGDKILLEGNIIVDCFNFESIVWRLVNLKCTYEDLYF